MERFFGHFAPTTREVSVCLCTCVGRLRLSYVRPMHARIHSTPLQYVSFKAGRCDVEDKGNNKFLIKPDRRKGLLMLVKVCCPSHFVRPSACLDLT